MPPDLHDVCCASIPHAGLSALADLRCHLGLRVILIGDHAWLLWPKGQEQVLRRVLPISGVEPYLECDGHWYRLNSHLPSFDLPISGEARELFRVLTPSALEPAPPKAELVPPMRLRLVPARAAVQTAAMLCLLTDLARWSETMPAGRLEALQAARLDEWVLVLGPRLPVLPSSERYWGASVLMPLGLCADPALPEKALREVLRLAPEEIGLLRTEGFEAIPRVALAPLARRRLRLACKDLAHHGS